MPIGRVAAKLTQRYVQTRRVAAPCDARRATLRRALLLQLFASVLTAMVVVALPHWARDIPLVVRAGIYAFTLSLAGISCGFVVLGIYALANTEAVARMPGTRRFALACGWGAFILTNPFTIGVIAALLAR